MKNLLLVGNPNTGKTTFFNTITKSDEHVGNWHGVTVDGKSKKFRFNSKEYVMTDLPGTYSLTTLSFEEQVTVDALLENKEDVVVNICDINNLERNLYLVLQLVEAKRKFVLFVNDTNTKKCYASFDIKKLSNILGVPVVVGNAQKKECKNLLNQIEDQESTLKIDYLEGLNIEKIEKQITKECLVAGLDSKWCAIKLCENDEKIAKKLQISREKQQIIENLKPKFSCSQVARGRFQKVKQILKECDYKKTTSNSRLGWFDKIATNKLAGVLLFFAFMLGVFYLTFFSLGAWLGDLVCKLLDLSLGNALTKLCADCPLWVKDFALVGVLGGLETLLSFLPQIVLLFLFLSILEETGYMSRVAFLFDDIFSKLGLSGKSAYTLIMGFGCATSAIFTARNMEDKNSQIKTALLAPFMSCSAKLPIYLVLGAAFFGAKNIFVVFILYLIGIFVSVLVALLLEAKPLKSKRQSFILEFPDYRVPSLKKILKLVWKNFASFISRVGGVLVFVNIIVWFLQSFSFSFQYVPTDGGRSILESLGKILAPVFIPLGFGNWGAVSALLAGVVAKEVVVSSIAIFNGMSGASSNQTISMTLLDPLSPVHFTPASCFSFLVFCLLYCPCLSSMVVLKKEIGRKWMWLALVIQLVSAYVFAFVFYTLFLVFTKVAKWKIITVACVILIAISFVVVLVKSKKKKCSACCENCSGCGK